MINSDFNFFILNLAHVQISMVLESLLNGVLGFIHILNSKFAYNKLEWFLYHIIIIC